VVDRHALAVWLGRAATERERQWVYHRGNNMKVQLDYRLVAEEVELHPHQLQAVCWVAWRQQ